MSSLPLSRRTFFKGGKASRPDLNRLNPHWPTPRVAKVIYKYLKENPPVDHSLTVNDLPQLKQPILKTNNTTDVEWTVSAARHLLSRTMTGPTYDEIQSCFSSGLSPSVNTLLETQELPEQPGNWVNEELPDWGSLSIAEINAIVLSYNNRIHSFRRWWSELMMNENMNITETITLFWHHFFATGYSKVFYPQAMYQQHKMLRLHGLGNFKDLLQQVTFGPAMMIWLDTSGSRKQAPNENFARELMELFSLGVNNYTQEDVVAASKAFTGYVTNGVQTNYNFDTMEGWGYWWTDWHDFEDKTFLGQTGPWTGDDIINIILEQDQCAIHICSRLYKWFVYDFIDESFVSEMADILRSNNYEIKPAIEFLFTSDHFHEPTFWGASISNPNQMITGTIKRLNMENQNFPNRFFSDIQYALGMQMFEPPDVNGWIGYHSWINSNTFPFRKVILRSLITGESPIGNYGSYINVSSIAQSLYNSNEDGWPCEQVVRKLGLTFFGLSLTDSLEQRLLDILLNGAEPYDWNLNLPPYNAQWNRMKDMLQYMMKLPEFQLA